MVYLLYTYFHTLGNREKVKRDNSAFLYVSYLVKEYIKKRDANLAPLYKYLSISAAQSISFKRFSLKYALIHW